LVAAVVASLEYPELKKTAAPEIAAASAAPCRSLLKLRPRAKSTPTPVAAASASMLIARKTNIEPFLSRIRPAKRWRFVVALDDSAGGLGR